MDWSFWIPFILGVCWHTHNRWGGNGLLIQELDMTKRRLTAEMREERKGELRGTKFAFGYLTRGEMFESDALHDLDALEGELAAAQDTLSRQANRMDAAKKYALELLCCNGNRFEINQLAEKIHYALS